MDKQRVLFENLKGIKDYWVKTSLEGLTPNADLVWSDMIWRNNIKYFKTKL